MSEPRTMAKTLPNQNSASPVTADAGELAEPVGHATSRWSRGRSVVECAPRVALFFALGVTSARSWAAPSQPVFASTALTVSDGGSGDYLGFSVARSADLTLVGAPGHAVGKNPDQGTVYSFAPGMSSWSASAESLIASDGALGDSFGFALAASADTVVVGAPGHQFGKNPYQGAAYVFVRSGLGWAQQGAPLQAVDGQAADAFGSSVAIDGDTILVGAPARDIDSKTDQGAAYVFVRADGQWAQQGGALTAANGRAGDTFGSGVALSGDTALASAPVHQVGINPYQGAAYVFVRRDAEWV